MAKGPKPRPIEDRLWERVMKGDPDQCWPFQGCLDKDGYGHLKSADRIPVGAHRVAWSAINGPIPTDMLVCHRCDNPPCCNPAHLFLGDQAANMADAAKKGRTARKLTHEQIDEISALHAAGWSKKKLAPVFGVGRTTIGRVLSTTLIRDA